MTVFRANQVNGTQLDHLGLRGQAEGTGASAINVLDEPADEHLTTIAEVLNLAEAIVVVNHLASCHKHGVDLKRIGHFHHHIALHKQHHLVIGVVVELHVILRAVFIHHMALGKAIEKIHPLELLRHSGKANNCHQQ